MVLSVFSDSRFLKSSEGKEKVYHRLWLLFAAWKIDKDYPCYIVTDPELMHESAGKNAGHSEYFVNTFEEAS